MIESVVGTPYTSMMRVPLTITEPADDKNTLSINAVLLLIGAKLNVNELPSFIVDIPIDVLSVV